MLQKIIKKLPIHSRWRLALKTIPLIVAIIGIKFVVHYLGYEFLTLNSLFTAIISANIFLIGFLISGTLVDHKESEKLPGDLASTLETMTDEGMIIYKNKKSKEVKIYMQKLLNLNQSLIKSGSIEKNELRISRDSFILLMMTSLHLSRKPKQTLLSA